ncbi:MAG: hypothetical protein WCA81_05730 [Rhizomicrobium sp.]
MTTWEWVFSLGVAGVLISGWILATRKGWFRTANVLEMVLWLWPF